jgi:hypothetical protein
MSVRVALGEERMKENNLVVKINARPRNVIKEKNLFNEVFHFMTYPCYSMPALTTEARITLKTREQIKY